MKPLAIVAAIIAGAIGACVWAAISYYAQIEVGYVAWGVGLLVGWAAHALGGEGTATGVICAIIALASMFGGKALSYHFAIDQAIVTEILPDAYEEERTDAAAYQDVESPDDLKEFLVTRGFSEGTAADEVTEDEIANFEENWAERLTQFQAENPDFDTWQKTEDAQTLRSNARSIAPPLVDGVVESLNIIDLIFGFLGVSTAFRMAMAEHGEEESGEVGMSGELESEHE